jgi:hypothetical protein
VIQRFCQLQRHTRKIDECVWGVWLDDFPVEICKWADTRLVRLEQPPNAIGKTDAMLFKTTETILAAAPTRTDARRPISGRLRASEECSLFLWAIAVAAAIAPAKSLYDPASAPLAALKQAAGLGRNWGPPDAELGVESFSVARMRTILGDASSEEIGQSLRDWQKIAEMVAVSDGIDWHAVRKVLNVQRTSSLQPPAPIDFLLALWRNFDASAAFLPFLISLRRSPAYSNRLSEILALGVGALQMFPRLMLDSRGGEVRTAKGDVQPQAVDPGA